MKIRAMLAAVALVALSLTAPPAPEAQAVCNSQTNPNDSVCGAGNGLNFIMSTTNTDGTPFNDYAATFVVFSPTAFTDCKNPGPGAQSRSMGLLGQPVTPLPNTTVRIPLGTITGLPQGKVFATVQLADTTGNISGCPAPVSFTYDTTTPAPATGLRVGP